VTATSPKDVWAVGASGNGTLTEHWDGTAWTQVPSPSPGSYDSALSGIAATSPTSAWAVGSYANSDGTGGALIEHWDGSTWTRVPVPIRGVLHSVAASSPTNAWAVGYYANPRGTFIKAVIEHWHGTTWTRVPTSSPFLSGVATTSPVNAWAVGTF
jgi:hypothetical protein